MLGSRVGEWAKRITKYNQELLWANVYHDTCRGISWTNNMESISPGRSAVGYNYMYVMTRILNELNPKSVLDIGLGISSTLISQFYEFKEREGDTHLIVEHDKEWINFYTNNHRLSPASEIIIMELEEREVKNNKYWAYRNFKRKIEKYKFDIVSIDAPYGYGGCNMPEGILSIVFLIF